MKKSRTTYPRSDQVQRDWYLIDAAGLILGRMSTKIATLLRGKHKPIYSPHVDCGDHVIVINAGQVRVTGKKDKQKIYFTHSSYPGGDKYFSFEKMMEKDPVKVVQLAVSGMLPKTRLGKKMIKKLKVYAGKSHPHPAKQLKKLEV